MIVPTRELTARSTRARFAARVRAPMWLVLSVCVALTGLGCGGNKPTQVKQTPEQLDRAERAPDDNEQGDAPAGMRGGSVLVGEELFVRKCSPCHGDVDHPIGPSLTDAAWRSESAVMESIRHGGGGPMPSFANRLPDALLRDIVLYLKFSGAR